MLTLQQIKDSIRGNIIVENLAKKSGGNPGQLHNGLAVVPESSMWQMVTWLHEVILPKVETHRGTDSEEYKNYVRVRDSVIWSLYIAGQYERLLLKSQKDRQLLGYYADKNAFLENELLKYTTIEQLITEETAADYRQSIVSRALELLNSKK